MQNKEGLHSNRGMGNIIWPMSKKGQVTIFIILAILIVVGVVIFFVARNSFSVSLPQEFEPVYD